MNENVKNNLQDCVKVIFCGGLTEVGKNMLCIDAKNEMIIIDCGIKMLSYREHGYNCILPDFKYALANKNKTIGLIVTHGHEDHIGAIPYLLKQSPKLKIYLPKIALDILKNKLPSHLHKNLTSYDNNWVWNTKDFEISVYQTVHSIPDAFGIICKTKEGTIVATGDWRIDFTPLGLPTEFKKLSTIATNCELLLSDSTNSLVKGFSTSEKNVIKNIQKLFQINNKRIIISAFASNLFRIKHIIRIAQEFNKKICIIGRSMENIVKIAFNTNNFGFDTFQKTFISSKELNKYPANKVVIVCTGSQGEKHAALTRMSTNNHTLIKITPRDLVILSSKPIPGNYLAVTELIENFLKIGAKVYVNTIEYPLHTSGHASKDEQKLLFSLIKPKGFVPIHGEYNMLNEHCKTAIEMGVPFCNVFLCKNGDGIGLKNKETFRLPQTYGGEPMYIDGKNIVPYKQNCLMLPKRVIIINSGIVVITSAINWKKAILIEKPIIHIQGTFYVKANLPLVYDMKQKLINLIKNYLKQYCENKTMIDYEIKKQLNIAIIKWTKQFIYFHKHQSPYVYSTFLSVE